MTDILLISELKFHVTNLASCFCTLFFFLRHNTHNYHTAGLDAPVLCKCAFFTFWGQEYKFRLKKQRIMLAFVQKLSTCVFYLKIYVIVSRMYSILSTFRPILPSKVYSATMFSVLLHFSCIILQLTSLYIKNTR